MKNIKFTVSKNIVTLPEAEGVDSFLIEASEFNYGVGVYEIGNFKASEYSPGTKVTLDADSIKQITVYAIIDGEKVFLRRASVRSPWTGIFDENYVSSSMFLEQANENTFPKAIIEDEQEVVEEVEETLADIEVKDEQEEVDEALAMAEDYKNDENFLQEKTVDELSDVAEKASLINHVDLLEKISKELERRKNPEASVEKDWEWLEPGTPEYYEYEYLPQLSLEALVAELNTLVNSLKQGKVRYQEMQTVEKEFNRRMHGNNEYRIERLIHFMIADVNGSERKEIERVQKGIADEIVAAEARWEQHDIDVMLGRINPYEDEDPLDLLLDDISVMLSSIQNYGDEFMSWINSDQEDAPF